MKLASVLAALLPMTMAAQEQIQPQSVTITVKNPTAQQRQEVVEVPLQQLVPDGCTDGAETPDLVVRNALGQAVTTQVTHDGRLLFEASVRPHASVTFSVSATQAASPLPYAVTTETAVATGAHYPNRADDLTWENDRCAYRAYGPALQRSGEKAFGYDVWSKSVPQPVVQQRYRDHLYGESLRRSYRNAGQRQLGEQISDATSFHYDHGQGLDAYGVGPSLGCGATALIVGDSLLPGYCWQQHSILDNGPLRFTAHLTYSQTQLDGQQLTEHRIISLDKGSHFNRCVVWFEGQQQALQLAAGVVVHLSDTTSLSMKPQQIVYADPTDRPAQLSSQVYVGVLFPEAPVQTRLIPASLTAAPLAIAGTRLKLPREIAGNAVGITTLSPNQVYHYYFGSAWSGYDVRTFAEWQQRAEATLNALQQPLQVTIR